MIHRLVVTVLVTSSLVAVWLEHQTILVDAFLTPSSSSSSSSWRTPPSIYQTTETTTRPVVSSLLKFQQEQEQQGASTTRYKNTRLFASTSQYNTDTLYAILNIDPSDYPQRYMIDKKVIRKAYKRMALQYHPDRVVNQHSTPEEKKYANDVFAQINAAYDLLMTTKQAQSSPSGPTQTTSSTASARTTASPSQTSTSTSRSGFNYHSATGNAGAYSPRHRRSSYYTRNNNGATTGYHGDYTQTSPNGGGQQYNYAYSSTVGSNPTSDWWRTSINATEAIDDDEDEVAVHYRPNKTATSTAFASGTSARYRPEFNYHSAAATATTGVDSKSPPRANGNSGRNHQRRRQQQQQQQRTRQEGFPSYHSSVDRTRDDTDSSNSNNNNMDPSSYYNYMTDPTTTTSENNDPSSYYSTTDPAITDTNDQVMMDPSYYDSIQDPATMDNIGDHYEYNNNNNGEDDNVLEEEYSHHPLETPAVVGEYNDGGYEEYEEDVETVDKDDIIIDTYSTVVDPYEGYESTKQSSSDWWRTMGDVDDDTSAQQHPPSPGRYAQATARHGNGQWWQTSIMDEEEEEEEGLFGDEIMEDIEGLHEEQLEEDYNNEMTFNSMNANHGDDYVTQSSLPLPTPPPSPPPRRPHQASTTTSSTASSNFYQSWSNPKAVEDSTDKWWQTTETGAPHEKTESFFNNANNKTSSSFGTSTSAADQKWWSVYLPKSEVTAATAKNFDEFLELIVEGYNSTLNDARFNTLLHNGTLEQVIEEMDHTELVVQQLSAKQTSVVYELQQVRSDQQIANNRPARVMLAQKFEKLTSRSQGLSDCVSKANSRLMSLQQVFWKLMLRAEQEEEEKRRQQIQEQQEELQRRRDRHIQPQQTFGRTTTTSSSSFPQPSTSSPSSSSSFTSSPSGTTGNGGIGSNNVAKRATIPYKPTPNYRRTSSVGGIRMTASDSTYSTSSSSAKDIFTRRDQAAGGFGTREGAGGAGIGNRVTGTHSNSNGARAPTTATKGRRSVIPRFARRTTNRPPVSRTPTTGVSLDIDAEDTSGTTPHTSPPKDVWRHRDHGSFYDRYRPHSNRSASSSSSPLSDFANPDIDSIIDYSDFSAWDQARRLAIVEEGLQALLKKGTEGGLHKMYRKIFRQMLKHAFGIKRGYALVLTDDFIETTPVISAHTLYRAPQDGITQRILSQCTTPELGLYLGYLILSADDP